MATSHSVVSSKIFWPAHISSVNGSAQRSSGYLIGWNTRSFIVCVAAVVSDVEITELEQRLAAVSQNQTDPVLSMLNNTCAVPPIILGMWVANADDAELFLQRYNNAAEISNKKQSANIWMTIECHSRNQLPVLRSVYSCGYKYVSASTEIVIYNQPNPLRQQFLSLAPVSLDLSPYAGFATSNTTSVTPNGSPLIFTDANKSPELKTSSFDNSSSSSSSIRSSSLPTAIAHTITTNLPSIVTSGSPGGSLPVSPKSQRTNGEDPNAAWQKRMVLHTAAATQSSTGHAHQNEASDEMVCIINQVNYSYFLEKAVRNSTMAIPERKSPLERFIGASILNRTKLIRSWLLQPLLLLIFCIRVAAELVLAVLDLRMPSNLLSGVTIKDFSAVGTMAYLNVISTTKKKKCYA